MKSSGYDEFFAAIDAELEAFLEAEAAQLNILMEQSKTSQPIPADYLTTIEFLPDGRATSSKKVLMQAWAEFAQNQVAKGKIKLYDIPDFDPDTGNVPNEFIEQLYLKNRTVN